MADSRFRTPFLSELQILDGVKIQLRALIDDQIAIDGKAQRGSTPHVTDGSSPGTSVIGRSRAACTSVST